MKYILAAIAIFFWFVFTIMFSASILGIIIVADEGWQGLVDNQFAVFNRSLKRKIHGNI